MVEERESGKEEVNLTKDAERKLIELSMLDEENKKIEQQMQLIEQQILNLQRLAIDLDEISQHEEAEFLASLGSGVFVKSKLLENKKVLINVGANCVLEKSCEEAKEIIAAQTEKLKKAREELAELIAKNFELMLQIETELRKRRE